MLDFILLAYGRDSIQYQVGLSLSPYAFHNPPPKSCNSEVLSSLSGFAMNSVFLNKLVNSEGSQLTPHQVVFLVLSCMSSLYILNINPLSDISFTSIFFHSVGCLFILLMVSFLLFSLT